MIIQRTRGKLPPGTWDKYEQTEQDIVVGKRDALTGLRGRWLAPDVKERIAGWPWDRVTVMEANRELDSRLPGVMIGGGMAPEVTQRLCRTFSKTGKLGLVTDGVSILHTRQLY